MYKITLINGEKEILLHHFSNDPEAPKILNAKGKFGFNGVPSVTIEVPVTNNAFNEFYELLSHIKIEDHNGVEIFYGRMINPSDSFNNGLSKILIFEGELAYLNDTTIRPHEWHDYSVKDFLREVLEEHNSQVEDYKKIYVGNVTVTANLYRTADYENTLTLLLDRLPNRLGGFFVLRKENGKKYLDYLLNVGKVSNQEIVFGENMIDYQTECDTTGIYTKLIPLGANKADGTEDSKIGNRLTINEVNDNKDYLINEDAAKIYGLIETTETWDDVTIASNLKNKGEEYLKEISKPRRSLKMKVADMHEIDVKYDKYNLGDEVPIKCKVFNVDERFRIIEIAIDFLNPLNTTYTFGNKFGTLTDNQLIIKNTQAKLDSFFNENGLLSSYLEGTINLLNNNMRAMVDSADRHNGTAILFECKVPGDLYGAMAIGTKGFMIADELNADGTWNWRTFGTAKGFVADLIVAGSMIADRIKSGLLMSMNEKTWINMDDGTFNFADKMKFNGTNFEVDLSNEGLATEEDIGNVIFKFSNSGGDNIIENGQFLDNINSWLEYISDFNGINGNRSVITPSNEWCIDGRNCLQIKATNSTTGHYGMVQSVVLKRNCTYTLSGYNASHRCLGFILIQRSSGDYKIFEGGNLKGGIGGKSDEAWDKWSFTFTTDDGNNGYNIYLGITECGEDAYCWYTDLMLSEGSVRKAYVPNSKELYNGKTVINKDGLTVYDGGIKIKNQLNNDVMWCDSEGWLTCNKLNTYGTEASIEIGSDSPGNKGLGIRSPNDSATLYLDFSPCVKGTDFTTIQNTGKFHRIATYGSKRDTLFLEVGAKLEIRKSKLDGLPVSMLVQGTIDSSDSISTQRNVTATGRVTAGGFAMSNGNTLIATDTISTIKYANNGAKSYIEVATPNFGTWGADLWASDERLKTNINDSDFTAINTILSINHIEFDYKDEILNTSNLGEKSINTMSLEETVSGRHIDVGYSAQQLYELDSNLVLEVPQEDGSILYQPRASAILPIATKAIQEQQEYIKKLENDITYFKNELEEIKSFLGI